MQSDSDESWINNVEEELVQSIENSDIERKYLDEKETAIRNIWASFQDSASSVAHLYRERQYHNDPGALWLPFQTAAGTVTKLYKDSCDGMKRTNEMALHCGYQRKNKEIADWARSKRRRYIRREDLLSYLAGKPTPHINLPRVNNLRSSPKPECNNHMVQYGPQHPVNSDPDLHTFKEALSRRSRGPELYAFVAGEIARNCKRPASPLDVNMEVQNFNSKRQRFL